MDVLITQASFYFASYNLTSCNNLSLFAQLFGTPFFFFFYSRNDDDAR